jgi:hypothetical protein
MNKLTMDRTMVDVYITNVCNLTCEDCRSFNNYRFKGHIQYDHAVHQAWASRLDIPDFGVLGGEPCLHPDLFDWLHGLRECWPRSRGLLITNGTHMSRVKNLHETLAELDYEVQISIHSPRMRGFVADQILQTFGICEVVPPRIDDDWKHNTNFYLMSSLGVKLEIQNTWNFQTSPFAGPGFQLHRSDPYRAHANCNIKHCTHFIAGKFYKCAVVGLMPEFLKQQGKPVPEILESYQPLTLENLSQAKLDELLDPIPQCQVCPENYTKQHIMADFKQPQILKRYEKYQPSLSCQQP